MDAFRVTAPCRVDLAGGTLDLWPLYCLTGDAKTINAAVNLKAVADFEVLPAVTFQAEVIMGAEKHAFEELPTLEECRVLAPSLRFPVMVLGEYLRQKEFLPEKKLKMTVSSEIPLRSGLGGSSALCVAMVRGLSRVFNDYTDQGWQWRMLRWVMDVEARFLGVPTGTQDYLASLFGDVTCYVSQMGDIDRVPYDEAVFGGLSDRALLLFSGEMHHSGLSNWEIFKNALEKNPETLEGLSSLKQVADALDMELRAKSVDWSNVGKLLDEEWDVRRSTFHVDTPRLGEIIGLLREEKVLGCKVCGAAQGGSLLVLVDPDDRDSLAGTLEKKGIHVLRAGLTREGVTIRAR